MPEMHFRVKWPDGSQDLCYSPSLVIKQYFTLGQDYALTDFVERSQIALTIASDRVQAKCGRPCGLVLGQLDSIECRAAQYNALPTPTVRVLQFLE